MMLIRATIKEYTYILNCIYFNDAIITLNNTGPLRRQNNDQPRTLKCHLSVRFTVLKQL